MHSCGEFKNCRRTPLHFGKGLLNPIVRHVGAHGFALASRLGTVGDIGHAVALPAAAFSIEPAENDIILDLFGEILGIWAIV